MVLLADLERRGSQPDTRAPKGQPRRIVYYDAALKLRRDFDFGAWDSPGIAGLASALGAGPKGITGIKPGGNKAGDTLRAHGTALYAPEGDHWVAAEPSGDHPVAVLAPSEAASAPQGRVAAIVDAMRKVADSVPKDAAPAQVAVIEEELAAAQALIRERLARAANGYAAAAGPEQGQCLRFVQDLSHRPGARIVPLVTKGSEENLRLLRAGKVPLALAQSDAALAAYGGTGSFEKEGPYYALRAMGGLYAEPVQVLVRARSGLASVPALRGHQVAIGQAGSASRAAALRVLQAHGLGGCAVTLVELPPGDALTALRRKEVGAVIQIVGVPSDSFRAALAEVPMRLLPLSRRAIEQLVAAKSGYAAHTIVRGTYAGQQRDVPTVSTRALLLPAAGCRRRRWRG